MQEDKESTFLVVTSDIMKHMDSARAGRT